ncbi:MAG TPA: IS481 family transposase, partial [Nitrosomonas sp.]|nr:IS481 family transposase [Nitrosomonas sp.]
YYNSHNQLKAHLHSFLMAYNFARKLKTLRGLAPYEYICKIWIIEPERFIVNPFHHTVGLNT